MEDGKGVYSAQEAKKAFMTSIYTHIENILNERGIPDFLTIDGSSIFADLPDNFFTKYKIPHGMRIEMKFVVKK